MIAAHRYGIIVAVEDYQKQRLPKIDYALNDAEALRNVFIESLGLAEANLLMLVGADASLASVKHEMGAFLKQVPVGSLVYLYYVGHARRSNGSTWLTLFDTFPDSLDVSALSLERDIIEPLARLTPVMFFDAGVDLESVGKGGAGFASCEPDQKSHFSRKLRHSIWAWHLLQALSGQARESVDTDLCLGAGALGEYLSTNVKKYLRDETEFNELQTPIAQGPQDLEIVRFDPSGIAAGSPLSALVPDFTESFWRSFDRRPYRKQSGFQKIRGHSEPDRVSTSARRWADELTLGDHQAEIKDIYEACVHTLGLKRSDMKKGDRSLDCDLFRFVIEVEQDETDPGQILVVRKLRLRVPPTQLTPEFDRIFPFAWDELVVPFEGRPDHSDLIKQFERQETKWDATLSEDESTGILTLHFAVGASLSVNLKTREISFSKNAIRGVIDLSKAMFDDLAKTGIYKGLA